MTSTCAYLLRLLTPNKSFPHESIGDGTLLALVAGALPGKGSQSVGKFTTIALELLEG